MKIVKTRPYQEMLKDVLIFISLDNHSAAINFNKELNKKFKALIDFPFMYKSSIYIDNEQTRDLIYKGYTIIYEVNLKTENIEILKIFNRNKP